MTIEDWLKEAKFIYTQSKSLIVSICPICGDSQETEIRGTKESAEMTAKSKVKTHINRTHKKYVDPEVA